MYILVYYATIKTYECDVMLTKKIQDMKLYMDYEFNHEQENILEHHWEEACENIEWLSLNGEIIDFFPL